MCPKVVLDSKIPYIMHVLVVNLMVILALFVKKIVKSMLRKLVLILRTRGPPFFFFVLRDINYFDP